MFLKIKPIIAGTIVSMNIQNQNGFTLIETLVVVSIVGILASISYPNYLSAQDRAREVEVKSNAKTIQIAVEDYKILSNTSKPLSITQFQNGVQTPNVAAGIPPTVKNPFFPDLSGTQILVNASSWNSANIGQIGYPTLSDPNTPYVIYGFGKLTTVITLSEGY